ncbi:MAG: citrate synthase/methylcitrate synthase [Thermoplasmata archaeon]|nr:citrate synthase/methylcitrate synthase [Thermoplasmata archaeon]MCI4359043.1 citrate synthase/methylcitrate synthase [Thermoplasmata archaeon]
MTGPSTPARGLEDVVMADSAISLVEGERGWLVYRGFDIGELMEGPSFESVVHLLVLGTPPGSESLADLVSSLGRNRPLPRSLELGVDAMAPTVPPMDALRTMVSLLGDGTVAFPPTVEQGLRLIARSPTLLARHVRRGAGESPVAPRSDLGHVANYLWMLSGETPEAARVRALERYFILLADHGMNASTFALRVVLSTQSDLMSAATAALAALKGPAHGGAPAKVVEMFDAIGDPAAAPAWIDSALTRRERLYGFGHRAYKVEDPRSVWLKRIAREVARPERYRLAEAVERAGLDALSRSKPGHRLFTNVEFYAAVVLEAVGLSRELFTPTFALARTAGWAAHALEQSKDNRLIRPDVRYTGADRGRRWPGPAAAAGAMRMEPETKGP